MKDSTAIKIPHAMEANNVQELPTAKMGPTNIKM